MKSKSKIVRLALTLALVALASSSAHAKPGFAHFEADAKGHSWANAYLLAIASYLAYPSLVKDEKGRTDEAKFRNAFKPYGLDVIEFISVREKGVDTQLVVARRDGLVVVVFAGSESIFTVSGLKDWLTTDLRARLIKPDWLTDIRVHFGFELAVDVVYARLRKVLTDNRGQDDKLWIAGHSLGGALAMLAAFRLHQDGHQIDGVLTYGAPKVGNKAWRQAYAPLEKRTQRWEHGLDPAPRVPPYPYRRVGQSNVIRTGGNVDLGSDQNLIALPVPTTHSISMYIDRIYKNLPDRLRGELPVPPKDAAKEERKEKRKEKRADRKDERKDKRGDRKDDRAERVEDRKEKRAERVEERKERKER